MKINIYEQDNKKVNFKNPKKISVIIPNYNYENFIIERIDSVIRQTYPIYELIILDDKSPDNSVKVIEKKIKDIKNINVKFIKNEKNSGCVFSQWQKGLQNISGDYFWIAEADDSSDCHFLEEAMKNFENNNKLTLFYSESYKINEHNDITGNNLQDWCDIFHTGRWNNDYQNNGKDEIINYLSNNNTILNVSSLVWKMNDKYFDIFEQAKKFKVAGDWYIYTKVLEHGDIAFCSKSLNYFRKHSKSVSTTIKSSIEYKETYSIQSEIKKNYKLSDDILEKQRLRRQYMGYAEDKKNNGKKGNIAWVIPQLLKGSGGHRTIIQNVNALIDDGYKCDIYVGTDGLDKPVDLYNRINEYYGECHADVFNDWNFVKDYDIVIATAWNTVDPVIKSNCKKKLYFVQDYEPYFFPMGDNYVMAENTYKSDISCVTIGKWLTAKLQNEFGLNCSYFDFCADLNVYKPIKSIKKEDAICYVFQPEKPRRCDKIALKALQIVKQIKPEIKIYVYGSKKRIIRNLDVENLGIIPIEDCNKLYNKCKVGICMSASNPSRIPFEMMASGLPVVELYRDNNLYDFPSDGCLLADTNPEAIASTILEVLDNPKLQKSMSKNGVEYMKNKPLNKGFEQFITFVNNFYNIKTKNVSIDKSYTTEKFVALQSVIDISKKINKEVSYDTIVSQNCYKASLTRRAVRKAKRIIKKILRRGE